MKNLILTVALLAGPAAVAHELDGEKAVSVQQIEKAKELPQTIVIRTSKADPRKVEVVHLKEKIPAGTKLTNLKFEKMAMNAEVAGIAYDSGNELDARSSTSSWSFGVYHRPNYGYRRPLRGYHNYDNSYYYSRRTSYYRNYDDCYGYRDNCYGYNDYYQPSYSYAGYQYNYRSYYGYSDNDYDYSYCNWDY